MGLLNNRWDLFQGLFRGYFEEMGKSASTETQGLSQDQTLILPELKVGTRIATIKNKQIKPA